MKEKITGAEGTKLDNDIQNMEQQMDVFREMVDDLKIKTKEILKPNPNQLPEKTLGQYF